MQIRKITQPMLAILDLAILGGLLAWTPTTFSAVEIAGGKSPRFVGSSANPPSPAPSPDDARKNRYVSFAPNNGANLVAFQIARTPTPGVLGWVGAPDANGISRIESSPVFRSWTEPVIHVGTCEIVPVSDYEIRAQADGEIQLTLPLAVGTILQPGALFWGDCVGQISGASFTPPNGSTNFVDILAAINGFEQASPIPPLTWVDVAPACPDGRVDFFDVYWLFKAFGGSVYPFPVSCGASCPCADDVDCDDGSFCTGEETCESGQCHEGPYPCPGAGCNGAAAQCDLFADPPPTVRLRPIGSSGTHTITGVEIQMPGGGQQVTLEIYISNWDQDLSGSPQIGIYQLELDGSGFSSGGGDPLVPLGFPATPGDGAFINTNLCFGGSNPGAPCTVPADCTGGGFCISDPDYFFPITPITATRTVSLDYAYAATSFASAPDNCRADNGMEIYVGTLIVQVPSGAIGNYTIGFNPDPAVTFLADCDALKIPSTTYIPAVVRVDACTSDASCDDGFFCTGMETCNLGTGRCANSGNPCAANQTCDEANDQCIDVGACCFNNNTACVVTDQVQCETSPPMGVGGLFLGAGTPCPEQNAVVVPEGGGSVFVHVIGPPIDCSQPPFRRNRGDCPPSGPYLDAWVSESGGTMCHNFGSPETVPIPLGFFGQNQFGDDSDVFSGVVCVEGSSLGLPDFGEADTVIERSDDPFDRCAVPSPTPATVDLEIVDLKMVSVAPITVTYNGGQTPEQWDVVVSLSPGGLQPGTPQSTLTATKTHGNGGTYVSTLYVQPKFTFTKVGSPGETVELDTLTAGTDPVVLDQTSPHPWVSDLDPNLAVMVDGCSDFHPNIVDEHPEMNSDCNGNSVRDKCEIEQTTAADCNGNARLDECDISLGFSLDVNGNSIPDGCEVQSPLAAPFPHDALKNRFVSFVPNNSAAVSLQVRHVETGRTMWVTPPSTPQEITNNVGRLVNLPPAPRIWTEPFIHVTGCLIVPVASYEIRATGDGVVLTPPLSVQTINKPGSKFWADTNGSFQAGAWTGPDGLVNFTDVSATVQAFQNAATKPPITWVDLIATAFPGDPNLSVNFADINGVINGFQGNMYPGTAPASCP